MNKKFKRVLALVLAGIMALSFAACDNGSQGGDVSEGIEGATIKMVIGSHPSWPYNENWKIWEYIEEATGANLEIQAIPSSDMATKVNLMMASPETLPDVLHMDHKGVICQHALSGAFVSLTQNLDKMPNFDKILDTRPEGRALALAQASAGDGEVYFAPVINDSNGAGNGRAWLYRKDIFDKVGVVPPTTEDEIIEVGKKLKAAYPDSYPLCFRNGLNQIDVMGPMWKEYFTWGFYYDFNAEKWMYGATEDTMKHAIEFFQRMLEDELVPPDFLTIATKSWQELILSDRGFMMPEYMVRIDYFNKPGRETNPEYTWMYMDPPKGGTETGATMVANYYGDPTGMGVCNTGDQTRINNALAFVDWYYSDDAADLYTWGKEGETYEVVDGVKKLILGAEESASVKYGIGTYGTSLRALPDPDAEKKTTPEMWDAVQKSRATTVANKNPKDWLTFNDEEQRVYDTYYEAVNTYAEEQLSKFILKQVPLTEWDNFQKNLADLGLDKLLEIYTSAYNRAVGK